MAVTKSKAEMVVTWHERGVDIETTCRMLGVTPQEASAIIRQHAAERERRERAERMRPKFIEPPMFQAPLYAFICPYTSAEGA